MPHAWSRQTRLWMVAPRYHLAEPRLQGFSAPLQLLLQLHLLPGSCGREPPAQVVYLSYDRHIQVLPLLELRCVVHPWVGYLIVHPQVKPVLSLLDLHTLMTRTCRQGMLMSTG